MAFQISPFLALAQEVRDIIYSYVLSDNAYSVHHVRDHPGGRVKRIAIGTSGRWAWSAHHDSRAPCQEYLSLMLVNRQLHHEIQEFLVGPDAPTPTAKLTLLLEDPKLYTTFTSIPQPPDRIRDLELQLKVNHIFHPVYISRGSQNAILTAVSDTLKRYIFRGPHLSRSSTLHDRLHLETVYITVSFIRPFENEADEYNFVPSQIQTLYDQFMALLRRFCRSGLPWGMIDAFNVRRDDGQGGPVGPWERVFVTSNIWDEEDFMFFQYGGFNWDAGDTKVVQPDLVAW